MKHRRPKSKSSTFTIDESSLEWIMVKELEDEVYSFVIDQFEYSGERNAILNLKNGTTVKSSKTLPVKSVIDVKPSNSLRNLNGHFNSINNLLQDKGIYIGCIETYDDRKVKFQQKYSKGVFEVIWLLDFLLHRVAAKLYLTRRLYRLFSRGRYNVVSKAEALGRLVYNGFEIVDYTTINGYLYFSVIKTGSPEVGTTPSYDLLFKMDRIGKNNQLIGVYKLRTMHPYSEFLQNYIVTAYGYNATGKPNNDFRLTSWGKILRKFHIDEIPQLLNVLKGELNIVGVRPLSRFGFNALPKDLQIERVKVKPGCIPPNVALKMTGFEGVIEAERIYLQELKTGKFKTNFKYFWMAIRNILLRKSSSA